MSIRTGAALCAVTLLAAQAPAHAQESSGSARASPAWLDSWSPLSIRADLPRVLPFTAVGATPLLLGAPRIGIFWSGANPGALALEVRDSSAAFSLSSDAERGDYRRPIDAGATSQIALAGLAWKPVGANAVMIGRIVAERETLDPAPEADFLNPFSSSPFTTIDTSRAALERTGVRIEGAGGWSVGPWGFGISAGLHSEDRRTVASGFARLVSGVEWGGSTGVTRELPGGFRVGVRAQLQGSAQSLRMYELSANSRAYEVQGYNEVDQVPLEGGYYRRQESAVPVVGASLSGTLWNSRWVLYADRERRAQQLWDQQSQNPPKDRWDVAGVSAGLAVQRALTSRLLVTIDLRSRSLAGNGQIASDSSGTVFTANEYSIGGLLELHLKPSDDGWSGAVAFAAEQTRRDRNDHVAGIGTLLETRTPGISLEVGRALSPSWTVTAGYEQSVYQVRGRVPDPTARGALYQSILAPEIALYATSASSYALSASLRWRALARTGWYFDVRTVNATPEATFERTVYTPYGSRTRTSVRLGVTMY